MNCSNIVQEETSGIVFSEVQQYKTETQDEFVRETDIQQQVVHQQYCHDDLQIAEDSQEVQVVNCANEERQIDSAGEPDHQQELSPIQDSQNVRRQTVQFCQQSEFQQQPKAAGVHDPKLDLESPRTRTTLQVKPEPKRLRIVHDTTKYKTVPTQKVKPAVIKSAAQLKLTQPIQKSEKPEEVLFEVEADLTEFYPSGACKNMAEMEVVRTVDQILKSIQQKFNYQQKKQEVGYGAPDTTEIDSLQQLYRKMRGESDVENRQVPVTNQSLAFATAHPAENVQISAKAAAQYKVLIQEKADREAGLGRFNNCNMRALPISGAIELDRNLQKTQRLTKYVQNHDADPRYAVQTPYDNLLLAERYATRQEILEANRNQQEELVNVTELVKMAESGIRERKREAQLMVIQQLQESQEQLAKTYGVIPQYEDCTTDQSRVLMEKNSASQNARLLDNAKRALQTRRQQIEKLLNLPFGEERARFVEEGQVEMFGAFLRQARTLPGSQQIEVTNPQTNVKSLEPVCFEAVDDDVFMSFLPMPPKVTTEMSIEEAEAAARARSFFFDQILKHSEKLKKAMESQ